jgi:hypothetical protein
VRVYDAGSALRCIVVGRTDGQAFGPVDAAGRIQDTGDIPSGSCADPAEEPLQLAVAHYADTAGTGSRSVLFGVVADSVKSVALVQAGVPRVIALDPVRSFVVPSEGLSTQKNVTITITLKDGTLRSYRL